MNPDEETDIVLALEESDWYCYELTCGHKVYSRVRLKYEKPNRQHHQIRCPECDTIIRKDRTAKPNGPILPLVPSTAWQGIETITEVDNEHVSNVHDGNAFLVPNRIMRLDNHGGNPGNPFPYTTRDRDY